MAAAYPDDIFGVACLSEAQELRAAGIDTDIMILGWTDPLLVRELAEGGITQTIVSYDHAGSLEEEASRIGVPLKCQIKIDTGMTRVGVDAGEEELIAAIYGMRHLDVTGIFTHLSSAYWEEPEDDLFTKKQFETFQRLCDKLESKGIPVGIRHCSSSPAAMRFPEYSMDMCRIGTALYGMMTAETGSQDHGYGDLEEAFCWKAAVALTRDVGNNTPVSYGRTFVTDRPSKLAVVTAGYADGFPRQMQGAGRIMIRGHACPVVGRVCMDMSIVDITGFDDIQAGDTAILAGSCKEGKVPLSWITDPLGAGPGQVLTNISARVPRVYL